MQDYSKQVSHFFESDIDKDTQRYIDMNVDIAVQVMDYLEERGWSQKEFAKRLNKSEAEVSKWLSGIHNLTLKSIAKMEAVLDEEIVITPKKASQKYTQIKYVTLQVYATTNNIINIKQSYPEMKKSGELIKTAI